MDRDGFEAFYATSGPLVLRQLIGLTRDRAEAEDCLQEAFARAWQRWSTVRECDNPTAWVTTVAHRLAVSRWRRTRNAATASRRAAPVDHVAGPSEDRVAIQTALAHLPAAQREAIVLHHLSGLSVAEIAHRQRIPEGTVKARLSRGRAALSQHLSLEEQSHA